MTVMGLSGTITTGLEFAGNLTVAAVAVADEVASYPERVQEIIVAVARELLELFTSDAIVSMWSVTDPAAHVLLTIVVAVLIDQAWRAASRRT